jgi:hypothetical protein
MSWVRGLRRQNIFNEFRLDSHAKTLTSSLGERLRKRLCPRLIPT